MSTADNIELPPLDGGAGVKTTRKGKKRRGKSDPTEQEKKLLCISGCKMGRDQSDNVIQCQMWAHYECIDEAEADIVGIWTCNPCRKMPDDANSHLVAMFVDQNSELQHLRDEIKQRPSKDTTNPATYADVTRNSPPKTTTILLGTGQGPYA